MQHSVWIQYQGFMILVISLKKKKINSPKSQNHPTPKTPNPNKTQLPTATKTNPPLSPPPANLVMWIIVIGNKPKQCINLDVFDISLGGITLEC